ncbi:CU044_5270 family protein [Streptomyces sp. BYX5S]
MSGNYGSYANQDTDELRDVRNFRAGAPAPDAGRLAEGRSRLTDAARAGRVRRIRDDWRIAAMGAAAAISAVTVLATGLGGGGQDTADRATPATTAPAPTGTVSGTPAEVLRRAADAVEKNPAVPEPRDNQWIYEKGIFDGGGSWPRSSDQPTQKPKPNESWTKYADLRFENGKEGDDRSRREQFRFLKSLPDDPAALLEKARAFYPDDPKADPEPRVQHDFGAVRVLLTADPMPPEALAKLYRALAAMPGVQVDHRLVRDLAGREAIVVGLDESGKALHRNEILIDPHTYEVLGSRWVVIKDYDEKFPGGNTPDQPWKTGDIVYQSAELASGVVDHQGDRP